MCTDQFTSGKSTVNNAVFICNEFVSAAATNEFQLEHTLWLLHTVYALGAIKYGLLNMGKY